MTYNLSSHRPPAACRLKKLLLLPVAGVLLALCSCKDEGLPQPPVIINTEPVGSGLSVIGFALLGAAVVCVLGKMLK
jgi:hypothetical protein